MILFHGTSDAHADLIMSSGLDAPYFTDDYDIAVYYAEVEVDDAGGTGVVITMDVDESSLLPDRAAMQEPVMCDEDLVMEEIDALPDDWDSQEHAWKTTLRIVSSVRVDGRVNLSSNASIEVI